MSTELKGREIGKDLMRLVNRASLEDINEVVSEITGDHRTLQQSAMRELVMPILRQWAKDFDENYFDLRNEQTVKMAKVMVTAWEKEEMRGFPLV